MVALMGAAMMAPSSATLSALADLSRLISGRLA
jgi:hypothetical protein